MRGFKNYLRQTNKAIELYVLIFISMIAKNPLQIPCHDAGERFLVMMQAKDSEGIDDDMRLEEATRAQLIAPQGQ